MFDALIAEVISYVAFKNEALLHPSTLMYQNYILNPSEVLRCIPTQISIVNWAGIYLNISQK